MVRRWIRFILLVSALLVPPAILWAEQTPPASLTADKIVYTSGYKVLRASGHVVIFYGTSRLEATSLTYDENNNRIIADGPIRLIDGKNLTIIASFAQLSTDMKSGVLKSARMVLNQQLQLTAVEIRRTDGRYNQLIQAAASSCTVSTAHPTPLWQIRARRIIHDEEQKVLFFEHAQLRFGNVPVAYFPRLRLPGPSVKRASGFLVPSISNSDTQGTGVGIPYFLTLGDYADATLTPRLYSSGTATLGFGVRKRFHRGKIDLTGSITHDTRATNPLRAYLFGDANFKLDNGFHADGHLEMTSDTSYLSDYGIGHKTRLESNIRLGKTTRASYFNAEITGYRSLATAVTSGQIPFVLGEVSMRRRFSPGFFGGRMGVQVSINSYNRHTATTATISNPVAVGPTSYRVSSAADWHRVWVGGSGVVFSTTAELHGDYYNNGPTTPPISRITPIAALDIRLPLVKQTGNVTQTIEPRVQVVWSPSSTTTVPNQDSQIVEFAATDLFALNHFTGIDRMEQGLRVNMGISYSRHSPKGWNIDATLGKVVRARPSSQFSAVSGLSGTSSSYVLGAQITLPSKFHLIQRSVFGGGMALTKNETKLAYKGKKFDISSSYLWLTTGAAGNTSDRSEWTVNSGRNFGRHWRGQANWRYDLVASTASDTGLSLTYSNECIKVDFSLSRRYAASSNVGPSTSLGLQVSLEGFGSRAASNAYKRKCSDF